MEKKGFLTKMLPGMFFVTVALWGCRTTPVPVHSPTCDEQLSRAFDITLVKECLDSGETISYRNLKRAIRDLNQNQYESYFHKAVYNYFNEIIFNDSISYRREDKDFLTAYIRYTIRQCPSKACAPLQKAKQLCNRLDSDLYTKFFE